MDGNRTQKSFYNMISSLGSSILIFIVRFIVRSLFLDAFGVTVLGYNSTFTSILSMLNLAELGIGIAITYKLYGPIAQNDYEKISAYVNVYRKLYVKIGFIILSLGIVIVPFLPFIVRESYDNFSFLAIIFILQLVSTVSSYWCAYKRILFNVYQEIYIINIVDGIVFFITTLMQVLDIIFWENYIAYLVILIFQTVVSNFILSCISNYRYKNIDLRKRNHAEKIEIKSDIGNVLIAKLGGYVLNSTDALVVSVILGASVTGYMVNYTTVFTSFQSMFATMLNAVQPSLGNKIVLDDNKKSVEKVIFNITFFVQILISGFCVTAFFLIDDFITLWISSDYILSNKIALMFSGNVYIYLMMYPISLLFGALGYYQYDKIVICIAAIINLILSITFVVKWGLLGVLLGTAIALGIYWVCRVIILYKKYFFLKSWPYVMLILRYFICTLVSFFIVFVCEKYFLNCENTIPVFVSKGCFYFCITLMVNIVINVKTDEMDYYINLVKEKFLKKRVNR